MCYSEPSLAISKDLCLCMYTKYETIAFDHLEFLFLDINYYFCRKSFIICEESKRGSYVCLFLAVQFLEMKFSGMVQKF